MKVLMLNGSPHKNGCTYTALHEMEKVFQNDGVETELIQIGHLGFRGCISCGRCGQLGHCVFDDGVNDTAVRFEASDGLVIGSPVYYGSPNGTLLSFLDRLFYSTGFDKTMKVGAAVVSCRRAGNTASFDVLNKYFSISGMPIATSQYWNNIHGFTAEDALKDAEGLQTMRTLARNMVFLMKSIELGKRQLGMPEKEAQHCFTSFPDGL